MCGTSLSLSEGRGLSAHHPEPLNPILYADATKNRLVPAVTVFRNVTLAASLASPSGTQFTIFGRTAPTAWDATEPSGPDGMGADPSTSNGGCHRAAGRPKSQPHEEQTRLKADYTARG